MTAMKKTAKNKRSIDEKIQIVISAIRSEQRRVEVFFARSDVPKYARYYSMAEIAKLSGYARSSRFMLTLYEMCDRGLLAKAEYNGAKTMKGRGICDVNIKFCLAEFAPKNTMKSMFTATATSEVFPTA